jgi:hypothetical protein
MRTISIHIVFVVILGLSACSSTAAYDQTSHERAAKLKVDSSTLIRNATSSAEDHEEYINDIRRRVQIAYEYERGKGDKNIFTIKQYEIMMDENSGLLFDFLSKWEGKDGGFSSFFVSEVARLTEQGWDEIIRLEWNKNR